MQENSIDHYTQSLLDRVLVMTREIDNLRKAYLIVNERLTNLSNLTEHNYQELIEEAKKVEDFARLAVEATKITEQSALVTKNPELIAAARKSTIAANTVHELALELRESKLEASRKGKLL